MYGFTCEYLDLDKIAASGQCFTWTGLDQGGWRVTAGGRSVEAVQTGHLITLSCTETEFEHTWRTYFDLDADYAALQALIDPADPCLTAAAELARGIRILRQDFWEVAVSFLISQNNNITRITRSVAGLCQRWGQPLPGGGYSFPRPDELLAASEEDFTALGLGYRAKYLAALCAQLAGGGLEELEEALSCSNDAEALEALTGLYGVGKKVADCIALFGLHRVDAFPRDTHINQILARFYPQGFPFERYRGWLGVVQQYLFYYDLTQ